MKCKAIFAILSIVFLTEYNSNVFCMDLISKESSAESKGQAEELKNLFSIVKNKSRKLKYEIPQEITNEELEEFKKLVQIKQEEDLKLPLHKVVLYATKDYGPERYHPILQKLLTLRDLKTLCFCYKTLNNILNSAQKSEWLPEKEKEKYQYTQFVLNASLSTIFDIVEYSEAKDNGMEFCIEKLDGLCCGRSCFLTKACCNENKTKLTIAPDNLFSLKRLSTNDIDYIAKHGHFITQKNNSSAEIIKKKKDIILLEFIKATKEKRKASTTETNLQKELEKKEAPSDSTKSLKLEL